MGRVKRGKTVRVKILSQQLDELADILDTRVMDVIAAQKSFGTRPAAQDLTPGQLLERMGFMSEQLSTPVKDLSGGQRRRLQLLLILLGEPNVLILDEPTNDLDTDILAAIEDLLDSWPGTLIVVSHDRYLLERVTDNQYAILGGRMRHLPGGVDEYLKLRSVERDGPAKASKPAAGSAAKTSSLGGAELRNAQKELAAASRKLEKYQHQISDLHIKFAQHDQSDYTGLAALQADLQIEELADLRAMGMGRVHSEGGQAPDHGHGVPGNETQRGHGQLQSVLGTKERERVQHDQARHPRRVSEGVTHGERPPERLPDQQRSAGVGMGAHVLRNPFEHGIQVCDQRRHVWGGVAQPVGDHCVPVRQAGSLSVEQQARTVDSGDIE